MPKLRLLLSLLSLACSKALQSVLISETSSMSFFFSRTESSHLPVDITSFHVFAPSLLMHPWRMGSVLQSLQEFCFGFVFCRKQLKPELWVPWVAGVPQGSHLPPGSQPSL